MVWCRRGWEGGRGVRGAGRGLLAAEGLQASCDRCLVFEDILPGIRAGKSAGMKVCAVEDEYSAPDREAKKTLADYYIEDYYGFFEK